MQLQQDSGSQQGAMPSREETSRIMRDKTLPLLMVLIITQLLNHTCIHQRPKKQAPA